MKSFSTAALLIPCSWKYTLGLTSLVIALGMQCAYVFTIVATPSASNKFQLTIPVPTKSLDDLLGLLF